MAKKKTQKTKSPRTPSASSTKSQPVPAPGQMTIPGMNEVRQALTVQPQIPAESLVHENNTTNPPDPETRKAMGFETETEVPPPPPPSPAIPMSAMADPVLSFGQAIAPLPRLQTPAIRPAPTPDPEPESEDNDAEDLVEAKKRLSDGSTPAEYDAYAGLPPWWRRVTKRLVSRAIVQVTSMPGFRSIVGWDKAAYNDLCARAENLRTEDTKEIIGATETALRAFKRVPNVNDPLRWASVACSIIAMTATIELFGMDGPSDR